MATAGDRYWELVKEQLTEERARKSSIEQRGIAVVTTAGTLVTLLLGFTALATKAQDYKLPGSASVFLAVAAVLFVATALAGIATNWAFNYTEVTPNGLRGLQAEDWLGDDAKAAKDVVKAWTDIIEAARTNNATKGSLLRGAMILEVIALAAATVGVLVVLGVL